MSLLRPTTCLRCDLRLLSLPSISSRRSPQRTPRRRTYATLHNTSPEIFDVVCVGGGPAGLSLVTALKASPATARLKIALVEGQPAQEWTPEPSRYENRCVSLTPRSVGFLGDIGAWEHVDKSRIQPYTRMDVWDGVSDAHISFSDPPPTSPSTIATMLENANITTALHRRLSTLSPPTLFQPAKVASISLGPPPSPDPTSLDLSSWPHLTLNTGPTLAARLLVGADGANSPVRTFAGIESRGWDYGAHGVVATLQLADTPDPPETRTAYQRFLPTGPIALLPLPGNRATLVWSTKPELAKRLKRMSGEDLVAAVNAAFRLSVADSYVGERIALMGDAAHVTHPLAGQGLNQGQIDAQALAKIIEDAVLHGEDIGALMTLERYNAERYAANNAMLGVVDKLHKLYNVGSGPIVGLRSLGLSVVDKVGPLKRFLMKQAAGV
ncbi:ubiquinone biosynthesis hydrox [Eremomyces bilateralis CBS 781.70]|uniref:Ubiquinone biosynthesis monooxygenase COQ6, mitochondrial n=1 Tax=Eremomyces bilateralis CBS 781.70 TaxID=1392243 RepID=A0A6G1FQZ2_9PEZI|nr:ubiquinone biosynthesis hydrox [Eremomyces bilateralis CBS 781.70]KAF1808130.1 ubiquinone biosynthesis hydrox [Eremomyces bilateralis CBS 781.70]